MGALGDLLAQQRTQAASTSTHQRRNPNVGVNADAGNVDADLEVGAQRGDAISLVETPRPLDHPGRGLGRAAPALSKKHSPLAACRFVAWQRPQRRR
jgi:hypothetical protein